MLRRYLCTDDVDRRSQPLGRSKRSAYPAILCISSNVEQDYGELERATGEDHILDGMEMRQVGVLWISSLNLC
jgi:hypothetical protein